MRFLEGVIATATLAIAIYVIVVASGAFVAQAATLGRKLNLRDYFIGSFIVGIGTSLPELFTSLAATVNRLPELVAPTIYSTVVANIAAGFGLGVLALFFFVPVNGKLRLFTRNTPLAGGMITLGSRETSKRVLGIPIGFAVLSVVLSLAFYYLAINGRNIGNAQHVIFLGLYVVFLATEIRRKDSTHIPPDPAKVNAAAARDEFGPVRVAWQYVTRVGLVLVFVALLAFGHTIDLGWDHFDPFTNQPVQLYLFLGLLALLGVYQWWSVFSAQRRTPQANLFGAMPRWALLGLISLSILLLYYAGEVGIEALERIADMSGIADTVLAATALAVGTSLPDMVVAIKVARLGRHMLLFGHILQSNTFDIFLVMGLCGVVRTLQLQPQLQPQLQLFSLTREATVSIWAAVILTLALVPLIWYRRIKWIPAALVILGTVAFFCLLLWPR